LDFSIQGLILPVCQKQVFYLGLLLPKNQGQSLPIAKKASLANLPAKDSQAGSANSGNATLATRTPIPDFAGMLTR